MNLRDELNSFYYSTALCDLRLMNRKIDGKNLSYNSLLYLELIHSMHGKCTASAIAELTGVSKPGVTSKLNELYNAGYIIKTPDIMDKRKIYLEVNEDKLPLFRIYKKQDELVLKRLNEHFSEADIEKFCKMLSIITEINYNEEY